MGTEQLGRIVRRLAAVRRAVFERSIINADSGDLRGRVSDLHNAMSPYVADAAIDDSAMLQDVSCDSEVRCLFDACNFVGQADNVRSIKTFGELEAKLYRACDAEMDALEREFVQYSIDYGARQANEQAALEEILAGKLEAAVAEKTTAETGFRDSHEVAADSKRTERMAQAVFASADAEAKRLAEQMDALDNAETVTERAALLREFS